MSRKILAEISARHVHVSQEHLEILFGKDARLTFKKALSQPGQYACEERVKVVGPKRELEGVSILGPVRPSSQVEISQTDARSLGISAPLRESGDIKGSGSCVLVGPAGKVELSEGVIVAKRHIHMTPEGALEMGLSDKEVVGVRLDTNGRSLVFYDVVVRVSSNFSNALHLDTDEANAALLGAEAMGEIVK